MCIRDRTKLEKLQAAKAQREAKAEDIGGFMFELAAVSYTHLDVYKRQAPDPL